MMLLVKFGSLIDPFHTCNGGIWLSSNVNVHQPVGEGTLYNSLLLSRDKESLHVPPSQPTAEANMNSNRESPLFAHKLENLLLFIF